MPWGDGVTIQDDIRRLERAIEALSRQVEDLDDKVVEAGKFQDGFQSVARTLAYVLGVAVMIATIYGVFAR